MTAADDVPAAIALLLAEHEATRAQFGVLRQAVQTARAGASLEAAVAQAADVLEFLAGSLELHIAREEGPLFPELKAALPADDRLIDEMVAEHDLIRIKRAALRDVILKVLDSDHDEVRAGLDALRDVIAGRRLAAGDHTGWLIELDAAARAVAEKAEVHFENEEELVFPLAAQLLDAATLTRIHEEIIALGSPGAGPDSDGA